MDSFSPIPADFPLSAGILSAVVSASCPPCGSGDAPTTAAGTAALPRPKKKRPHLWGHSLKEAMEGKSGKAMQGADPPAGPAYCEMSRTESEGQARPLFLPWRGALARPKRLSLADSSGFHASPCNHATCGDCPASGADPSKGLSGAINCRFLHIGCSTLLRPSGLND
jgi:hypothetical protein